ncbi:HalOD1 output domain-containing protein [Haladaptatus salinisoli]|uniref:HalOD1 output domain-containing protein n=1 Tax=Haladaptatus salinisoli TaxID=2884876 RepID=UPI001D0A1B3B|nr:HalOD1 output domain-containing protein [Haladaptatus salinisoli]
MKTTGNSWDDGRPVSEVVVEAVAEETGTSPERITPPLYDAVDPEALNNLFEDTANAGRREGRVVFAYSGFEVTVREDGSVALEPMERRRASD